MVTTAPLPDMYVPKSVDERRVANFMKMKWPALTQLLGRPESTALYYSSQDFITLFNNLTSGAIQPFGCRMYFANYCRTGEPAIDDVVSAGYENQLTIIFAATHGNTNDGFNDLGNYFIIHPNGGVFPVSKNSANQMVLGYRNLKLPLLEQIVKEAGIADFEEGRAMWIGMDSFTGENGLIAEMTSQEASGISLCFAAYGKDETSPSGAVVSWQLTAVFILAKTLVIDGNSYIYHFDIEDVPGFGSRPPKAGSTLTTAQILQDDLQPEQVLRVQFDTINPCPPATNCGELGQP